MASLVAQLQADALDRAVPVTDLLRKAKVTAVKLGLGEFRTWVDRELNGYEQEEVPSYRHVRGEPKGFNPFHGWQPVIFHNAPKHQEALSERWIAQSVSALEDLAREAEGPLMMPYAASVMDALNRGADGPPTHYALFTDRAALAHVIDAVRNAVLDWALKLEQAGIVGEELSFSETEKAKAHEPNIVYQIDKIENFVGNLGPVGAGASVSAVQTLAVPIEAIRGLCEQIKKYGGMVELPPEQRAALDRGVAELEVEIAKPSPEPSKMRSILGSVRASIEGAAGNIIAAGIIQQLSKLDWPF